MNFKIFITLLFFSLLASPLAYCEEREPPKHNLSELRHIVQEKTLILEKFTKKLNAEASLIDKKIQEIKPFVPENINNLLETLGLIYFPNSNIIVDGTDSPPVNEIHYDPFELHQEIIDEIISQRWELEKKWNKVRRRNDTNEYFNIFADFLELKRDVLNTWITYHHFLYFLNYDDMLIQQYLGFREPWAELILRLAITQNCYKLLSLSDLRPSEAREIINRCKEIFKHAPDLTGRNLKEAQSIILKFLSEEINILEDALQKGKHIFRLPSYFYPHAFTRDRKSDFYIEKTDEKTYRLSISFKTSIPDRVLLAYLESEIEKTWIINTEELKFSVDVTIQQVSEAELGTHHGFKIQYSDLPFSNVSQDRTTLYIGSPEVVTGKVYAHEFGHILGYEDLYTYYFDFESGLAALFTADGLMGNEAFGIDASGIKTLIQTYFQDDLITSLVNDTLSPEPEVRAEAAYTLGEIGVPAHSSKPFIENLIHDYDIQVQMEALRALRKISFDPEEALAIYLPLLESEETGDDLKLTVINNLGEMGHDAAKALPLLEELSKDENLDVIQAATQAILKITTNSVKLKKQI